MAGMEQYQGLALQQTLSPQMRQSLSILQAPVMELRHLVAAELEANPVLEEELREAPPEEVPSREVLSDREEAWNEYFAQRAVAEPWTAEAQERRQHFLDSQTRAPGLQEHLMRQLAGAVLGERERGIARVVIGNIDDRGYLEGTDAELGEQAGCSAEEVGPVVRAVQALEPAGVGARTLAECLLLQLRRSGRGHGIEMRIVRHHLEELGRRKLPEIARSLRVSVAEVQRAAGVIARLDPRPGRQFSAEVEQTIQADVVVEKDGTAYVVSLNDAEIPALRIGDEYKDMLAQPGASRETREYLRDKIRGGRFFIKCLQQRQHTLLGIAREIVERQREFFDQGPALLRPMTMDAVAQAVGVHETTVSRAVSGKYIQTPRGLFELKYFFTSGYTTAEGQSVSNESVRQALSGILEHEDPRHPLSDQDIVATLAERGISVARRTVAKYRDQLGILPSHLRKTF